VALRETCSWPGGPEQAKISIKISIMTSKISIMTSELLAILIVAVIQIVGLVTPGLMLREMRGKNAADDAAIIPAGPTHRRYAS
jgi:hypothetical protein